MKSPKEKRKYTRQKCKITTEFNYYEVNPDEMNMETAVPFKGKGVIWDISKGGAFLATDTRVSIDMPIKLFFELKGKKYEIEAVIVRTGLLKNNPSEIAQRLANEKIKEETYIAVCFDKTIDNLTN